MSPNTPPNGNAVYYAIQEQIQKGDYDFQGNCDPKIYFARPDSEKRYLQTQRLSKYAKALYEKVFAALRKAGIPCVVFETGRTAAYQHLIDENHVLHGLQNEWRHFFASQSYGCVKFLDVSAVQDCYDEKDFFDAVHFVGKTGDRLAKRLADAMIALEQSANRPPKKPAG